MGYSLNELLDATGIDKMSGTHLTKTAQASSKKSTSLSKLAERCREAASASQNDVESRSLVEKTASVAIIQKVLDECARIEDRPLEKKAAPRRQVDQAAFIKRALSEGHPPEDIAEFLEKLGFTQGLKHYVKRRVAGYGFRGANRRAALAKDVAVGKQARLRELAQDIEGMSPAKAEKAVRGLVAEFGGSDAAAFESLKSVMPQVGKRTQAFKDLKRLAREADDGVDAVAGQPRQGSFSLMGQEVMSPKTWGKVKKSPWTYGIGGAAGVKMLNRDGGNKRKGNVTVIQ